MASENEVVLDGGGAASWIMQGVAWLMFALGLFFMFSLSALPWIIPNEPGDESLGLVGKILLPLAGVSVGGVLALMGARATRRRGPESPRIALTAGSLRILEPRTFRSPAEVQRDSIKKIYVGDRVASWYRDNFFGRWRLEGAPVQMHPFPMVPNLLLEFSETVSFPTARRWSLAWRGWPGISVDPRHELLVLWGRVADVGVAQSVLVNWAKGKVGFADFTPEEAAVEASGQRRQSVLVACALLLGLGAALIAALAPRPFGAIVALGLVLEGAALIGWLFAPWPLVPRIFLRRFALLWPVIWTVLFVAALLARS